MTHCIILLIGEVPKKTPVIGLSGVLYLTSGDLFYILERDVSQCLERGALSMSLSAVRFRIPLDAGFSLK